MDYSQEVIQSYLISHLQTSEKTKWNLHVHPTSWEILLFKKGNVDYYIDNHFFHLRPGDLLLIPPNLVHGYCPKDDSPYERLSVHFGTEYAAELCTTQTNLLKCFSLDAPRYLYLGMNQIALYETYVDSSIFYMNNRVFGKDLFIKSAITLILLLVNDAAQTESIITTNDTFPELIQHTLTYVEEHYTEPLSIQQIADELGISSSRLSHAFKEFMGISLWNHVIMRRIKKSKILLKEGLSITEVCYECGFQDYSHFIRSFRKIVGVTPKKYVQGNFMHLDTSL